MGRIGNSAIKVAILGDAKGLQKELATSERGIKGFATSGKALVGGIVAAGAGAAVLDFAQTALGEADRLADAGQRLQLTLGDDLAGELQKSADKMSDLGLSAQDVLELEAAFADTATALGAANPAIASFADDAAATAAAVSLLGDQSPDEVIDLIGKAAGGSEKALRALGINVTDAEIAARAMADTGKRTADALTDADLAAAGYALVLEALQPKLDAVANSSGDVEQAQAALEAKFETLTGKIGAGLEGPLNDLLQWMLNGIEGWEMLADAVPGFMDELRKLETPLGNVADLLADIVGLAGDFIRLDLGGILGRIGGIGGPRGGKVTAGDVSRSGGGAPSVTVNVNGGDPAETERAVRRAVRGYNDRNGSLITG